MDVMIISLVVSLILHSKSPVVFVFVPADDPGIMTEAPEMASPFSLDTLPVRILVRSCQKSADLACRLNRLMNSNRIQEVRRVSCFDSIRVKHFKDKKKRARKFLKNFIKQTFYK